MNNESLSKTQFNEIAKKHLPTPKKGKNIVIAFISGGSIGLIGQILMEFYRDSLNIKQTEAMSLMIVTVVLVTAILTGLGIFDKLAQICGAGTFIPISGFANALTSSALESKAEGLIFGIGSNMFKVAGSVITYGVVSAYIFGMIRYVCGF